MSHYQKNLIKIAFATAFALSPVSSMAQWAVIDAGNISQTSISASNAIKQTAKQLEQYRQQLAQLQDQIKNSIAPAKSLWDKANETVKDIQQTANTLKEIKRQAGNIDTYLRDSYGSVQDYMTKKCYTSLKCTKQEWDEINNKMAVVSMSQKRATEALIRTLDQHEKFIEKDAAKLVEIQSGAETAEGRMAAMGYANQLASAQVSQLIQLRSVIIAQETAAGIRQAALEDREAQYRAVGMQLREGDFEKSEKRSWSMK